MTETFGERLKRLRKARGMTQDTLAAAIGLAHKPMWRWETGKVNPAMDNIAPMARALDVSCDYLLTGAESPQFLALKANLVTERAKPFAVAVRVKRPFTMAAMAGLDPVHALRLPVARDA